MQFIAPFLISIVGQFKLKKSRLKVYVYQTARQFIFLLLANNMRQHFEKAKQRLWNKMVQKALFLCVNFAKLVSVIGTKPTVCGVLK